MNKNCVINSDAKYPCKAYEECLSRKDTNKPLPCMVNWMMGKTFENMIDINKLKNENKRLRNENEKLIQNQCIDCELVSLQTKKIDTLEKENEQLQQNIQYWQKKYEQGTETLEWRLFEEKDNKIKELEVKILNVELENDELKQQLKTKNIVNKQYEELQRLKKENKELKIANAKWLDKSLKDRRMHYTNTEFNECKKLAETNKKLQEQLEKTIKEKEHMKTLYNKCRELKLSDEAIKQAYANLNRREREKRSQGNATFSATLNPNEVIY